MLQKSKHFYVQVSESYGRRKQKLLSPFGAESAFVCDKRASLSSSAIS